MPTRRASERPRDALGPARLASVARSAPDGADRSVNTMWRKRWNAEGVFCVLYSASKATCEVGDRFFDQAEYGPAESGGAER